MEMCLDGLRKSAISLPGTITEVLETVCSMSEEKCVDRNCENCGVSNLDHYFEELDDETETSYCKRKKNDTHIKKELIVTDLAEVKGEFYSQMESFARHVYNVKHQHKELKYLKENLNNDELIIQEDFAENHTLRQQNEIMAAHWSPQQVTVFTAVVYYSQDQKLQHISYAIVSNELDHNKQSVAIFNKRIIDDVKKRMETTVNHIHYWTDGCGAQFKNKFTLSNLLYHKQDHGCSAD